jgi:hypothetical protein
MYSQVGHCLVVEKLKTFLFEKVRTGSKSEVPDAGSDFVPLIRVTSSVINNFVRAKRTFWAYLYRYLVYMFGENILEWI